MKKSKYWVDIIAIVIAFFALLVAFFANNEASKQNTIAAVAAQIQSCSSLADAERNGLGNQDSANARTKAQHLSRCLVEFDNNGYEAMKICVREANSNPAFGMPSQEGKSVC